MTYPDTSGMLRYVTDELQDSGDWGMLYLFFCAILIIIEYKKKHNYLCESISTDHLITYNLSGHIRSSTYKNIFLITQLIFKISTRFRNRLTVLVCFTLLEIVTGPAVKVQQTALHVESASRYCFVQV